MPEKKFPQILVAIRDSLSNITSSDDGDDREAGNDEETQQGKVSEDDEHG